MWILLLWALCWGIGCLVPLQSLAALAPGDYDFSLTQDERVRTYLVHVPPQAKDGKPLPLVLVFHGAGGRAQGQKEWAGLDPIADREGFLVVYPDGTGWFSRHLLTWNAGGCCGYARLHNIDDVGFVVALLQDLAKQIPIDHRRVYATGMSNGAMMSYRLAAEIPERIAAIAPVAGGMMVNQSTSMLPMPVMHFHSVDDPRAPYAGGFGPFLPFLRRVEHPSIEEVVQQWVRHNSCAPTPTVEATIHGKTEGLDASHTATKMTYGDCRDGAEVVLWKMTGAGHVWPGPGPKYPEWLLGPPTSVINASEEMWAFFQRFSRPDALPLWKHEIINALADRK